jgi:tetratricopeptide (TPR) repeat protein
MRKPKAKIRNVERFHNPKGQMSKSLAVPAASFFGFRISGFLRISGFGFRVWVSLVLVAWSATQVQGAAFEESFREGAAAYRAGDYARSVAAFRQSTSQQPASGTLQSLGSAEWKLGRAGAAILAWEQALWLDPFNQAARMDLRFGRKTAQLEAPELAWYEVISTWLPANWWAWIAGASLWLAVGMVMLPGILRVRKAAWHQAVAALGLMVFLLSVPAYLGLHTRSRIGFVLQKDTPLRLTPTLEAQAVTHLAAGEPARFVRMRGNYVLIRTSRALGWVEPEQFGLTCPRGGVW